MPVNASSLSIHSFLNSLLLHTVLLHTLLLTLLFLHTSPLPPPPIPPLALILAHIRACASLFGTNLISQGLAL